MIKLYGDLIAPIYKPVVDAILENKKSNIILKGGRGSAKGDTIYTLVGIVLSQKPQDAFVFVPQQSGMRHKVIAQVSDVLNRLGVIHKVSGSVNQIELTNGSLIIFGGLDASKKSVNLDISKGYASTKPDGFRFLIFDELGATEDYQRINNIINGFVRGKNKYLQIIEISNPPMNKTHSIYKRYKEMETNDNALVLHTTVYDLPVKWINDRQIKYINSLRENNKREYQHSILGESVGMEGLAYEFSESDIWCDLDDYVDYQIFTDEATVNATTFCLYGITANGDVHLIDCFYHSSKDDGKRYSPSEYAEKFKNWIIDLQTNFNLDVNPSKVITDGLPFTMELKKIGVKAQSIGKLKDRALSYYLSNKLIMERSFKIVRNKHNNIFYEQLTNATLIFDKHDKPLVDKSKESTNDNAYHTHALDTFLYFTLANQKIILKGKQWNK